MITTINYEIELSPYIKSGLFIFLIAVVIVFLALSFEANQDYKEKKCIEKNKDTLPYIVCNRGDEEFGVQAKEYLRRKT